jgi:hypothetical protein
MRSWRGAVSATTKDPTGRILANQGAARCPPPSYRACPFPDDGHSNGPPLGWARPA